MVLEGNVCLAGVPMMNGASTLEGYAPNVNATVVTCLLDVGATVVGKAVCDSFRFASQPPHGYENIGKGVARILWVNTPATF